MRNLRYLIVGLFLFTSSIVVSNPVSQSTQADTHLIADKGSHHGGKSYHSSGQHHGGKSYYSSRGYGKWGGYSGHGNYYYPRYYNYSPYRSYYYRSYQYPYSTYYYPYYNSYPYYYYDPYYYDNSGGFGLRLYFGS